MFPLQSTPPSDLTSLSATSVLARVFQAALSAVDPLVIVPPYLPPPPAGRTVVIGAGKAAARMAEAVERHWQGALSGVVVTRYGHGAACAKIEVIEAGHPVPDSAGLVATARIIEAVTGLGRDDLVICLISGGGSALLTMPAPGIAAAEKQAVNRALLRCGAPIHDMNCVRRHVSAIKGGNLLHHCGAARVVTLVISDVPGDDPAIVASGPTIPDASTPAEALDILERYDIEIPPSVRRHLTKPAAPLPKAAATQEVHVIATAQHALDAAAAEALALGYTPLILSDRIEGESRDVGRLHAAIALHIRNRDQPVARPALVLSGGETTVTVTANNPGRGGRNQEFLLALALALDGATGIHALACDTDGIDGSEDNAGAILDPDTLTRARATALDPRDCLLRNDAYAVFAAADALVVTGPTRTNVNDFRAVLVL